MRKKISSFYFQPAITHEKAAYPGKEVNLIIATSKHLHMLKSGKVKKQDKIIDYPLGNLAQLESPPSKDVIVHFLLKDSFSGLLHAESYSYSNIISIESFLYRAFKKKKAHPFHGIPEKLVVPASVLKVYPSIEVFCHLAGVKLAHPENGFRSGIDSLRYWENWFPYYANKFAPSYVPMLFHMNYEANSLSFENPKSLFRVGAWLEGLDLRPTPIIDIDYPFEEFITRYWPELHNQSGFKNEFVYSFDNDNH